MIVNFLPTLLRNPHFLYALLTNPYFTIRVSKSGVWCYP